jgi:EpsI family protein
MPGRVIVLVVLLLSTAGVLAGTGGDGGVIPHARLQHIPMQIDEWTGTKAPDLTPDVLEVLGVDAYINRTYAALPDQTVGLYVGFYERQRQGHTMHSPLNCLPGSGWAPLSNDRIQVDGRTVNRYIVAKGADRLMLLYWYQSHGRVVASEYAAKFYLVSDALRLHRTDGALVRVVSVIRDGEAQGRAERRAVEFVRAMLPTLSRYLPA